MEISKLKLIVKNLKPTANELSWQDYELESISVESIEHVGTILETDQISFHLEVPGKCTNAVLLIGDAEISNYSVNYENGLTSIAWIPKADENFGYKAFFLHYCGVATPAVIITEAKGDKKTILFDSINVCGRKVTAERVESMLEYISSQPDAGVLKAISPTSFKAKLVGSGVSAADMLQRLEQVIGQIEIALRRIISKPITALRPEDKVLKYPLSNDLDFSSVEWIADNAGKSIEADGADDGLFKIGLTWRKMDEVVSINSIQSTDIYENQLIRFYLSRLNYEAKRLHSESLVAKRSYGNSQPLLFDEKGHEYVHFHSIARRLMLKFGSTYEHRAFSLLRKTEAMLALFDSKIPTSKKKIRSIHVSEKMKANRHYVLIGRHIYEWLVNREILWVEKNVLSSISSTPKLFEYYTVILTHNCLVERGEKREPGLFDGVVNGRSVKLLYEPKYYKPKLGVVNTGINVADRYTGGHRNPDIVIDINYNEAHKRKLLILDAKCRAEINVLADLKKCILKYGYGIRDEQGFSPVNSIVMLHPKPRKEEELFIDYYEPPYNLYGKSRASPVLGCQRIDINRSGVESGFSKLIDALVMVD